MTQTKQTSPKNEAPAAATRRRGWAKINQNQYQQDQGLESIKTIRSLGELNKRKTPYLEGWWKSLKMVWGWWWWRTQSLKVARKWNNSRTLKCMAHQFFLLPKHEEERVCRHSHPQPHLFSPLFLYFHECLCWREWGE